VNKGERLWKAAIDKATGRAAWTADGVSVCGTGEDQGDPHLDLELLDAIRRRVEIPLVMHGGSGLSDVQFRSAVEHGIAKINVATELFMTSAKRIVGAARDKDLSYFEIARLASATFRERCGYYIDLFGEADRV